MGTGGAAKGGRVVARVVCGFQFIQMRAKALKKKEDNGGKVKAEHLDLRCKIK